MKAVATLKGKFNTKRPSFVSRTFDSEGKEVNTHVPPLPPEETDTRFELTLELDEELLAAALVARPTKKVAKVAKKVQ